MKLSSGLRRELVGHFALDEDGLQRIVAVLDTRASSLTYKGATVLAVDREDDRYYETTRVADVLSDASAEGHQIRKLFIELRIDDPTVQRQPWEREWIVKVAYASAKRGSIWIEVNSEDRTWALQLADDLEPQVRRTRADQRISTLMLVVFFCAAAAFVAAIAKGLGPGVGLSATAIERVVFCAWCIGVLVVLNILDERPDWVRSFAGPESAFNWGERAKSFQRGLERQKNFFWVVVVGFIVSIASSLYTTAIVPPPPSSDVKAAGAAASAP